MAELRHMEYRKKQSSSTVVLFDHRRPTRVSIFGLDRWPKDCCPKMNCLSNTTVEYNPEPITIETLDVSNICHENAAEALDVFHFSQKHLALIFVLATYSSCAYSHGKTRNIVGLPLHEQLKDGSGNTKSRSQKHDKDLTILYYRLDFLLPKYGDTEECLKLAVVISQEVRNL
ncbi:hypothetical protein EWB00_005537 [Schistosoma japonicum]|uniref:Uncharacterized protein n=1 Tax=Schistosoma japonicum TaxID=6182 RepID=A0A4Z2D194_SCHJA|nr:hypothetical protein KSF78_0002940 [Schistosoma japonicum]TNN10271.1 hypothetical protein EWB00_005537 [Schistosoma japonicum]